MFIEIHHRHRNSFSKRLFLLCFARVRHNMKSLHKSLNIPHSGCRPSNFMSSFTFTHSPQVFLSLHFTPANSTPLHPSIYILTFQMPKSSHSATPHHINLSLNTRKTVQILASLYILYTPHILLTIIRSASYYWINTCIHETNRCMTIYVLGQYLKHNTCIVLQYMYCVTSPQCVPSFTLHTSFSLSYALSPPDYADFQPSSPMFRFYMSHSGHRLYISPPCMNGYPMSRTCMGCHGGWVVMMIHWNWGCCSSF